MALTINTNVSSLTAQRHLNNSSNSLSTSMERLASGLRINSAKDDAAGLAISDRMTSQITGLTQAARNANDGISMAQTAEGALQESTNILQRIRELAVQSANDTNSASDRASLDAEVQQLKEELNRIASTTEFNGKTVIDGTMDDATFQVGPDAGEQQRISFAIGSGLAEDLSQEGVTIGAPGGNAVQGTSLTGSIPAGSIIINGNEVGAAINNQELADAINTADDSVEARAVNYQEFDFNDINLDVEDDLPVSFDLTTTAITFDIAEFGSTSATSIATADTTDALALATALNAITEPALDATASNIQNIGWEDVATGTTATDSFAFSITDSAGVTTAILSEPGTDPATTISAADVIDAINVASEDTGVTASYGNDGEIMLSSTDGSNFSLTQTFTNTTGSGFLASDGVTPLATATASAYVGEVSLNSTEKIELSGAGLADAGVTAGSYPGPAYVYAEDNVLSPLESGDLVVNGNDIGNVEGDAKSIAEAIQLASPEVIATPQNSQSVSWNADVVIDEGDYIIELDGAVIPLEDTDGNGEYSATEMAAAINATDGFTAEAIGTAPDEEIVINKAGGSNFTINQRLDDRENVGFDETVADGRDLRGTIILQSETTISIEGTDPGKAGLSGGDTVPIVKGNYDLNLTLDDGSIISVDTANATKNGIVTAEDVANAINADANATMDFTASVTDEGKLQIVRNDGTEFKITEIAQTNGTVNDDSNSGIVGFDQNASIFLTGQVELDSAKDIVLEGSSLAAAGLLETGDQTTTVDKIDILTSESSVIALASVDAALMDIDSIRGELGAIQNRFESTISNLNNVSENLSAARSRILDTDIAAETSAMTKSNVLQQAGVSVLSQANTTPELALSLLQ